MCNFHKPFPLKCLIMGLGFKFTNPTKFTNPSLNSIWTFSKWKKKMKRMIHKVGTSMIKSFQIVFVSKLPHMQEEESQRYFSVLMKRKKRGPDGGCLRHKERTCLNTQFKWFWIISFLTKEITTGWFLSVPCLGINNFLVFWSWRAEILHT